jgi:predicted GNAT family acetyltransferase
MSMSKFRDNAGHHRYEFDAPEGDSFAEYRDVGGVRQILHVETAPEAQGRGYAAKLMDGIVEDARANGRRITPFCSYAQAYFARNKSAGDVLD